MQKFVRSAALAVGIVVLVGAGASAQKSRRAVVTAVKPSAAKPENTFGTIDEFIAARKPARTVVTIEGYTVVGFAATDGTVRGVLLDSVDRVLSASEADSFGRRGARFAIPASLTKSRPRTAFKPKGFRDLCMYTGRGHAEKLLKDVISKVRVTGTVLSLGFISPVTKVEYQDDNGDWKTL
jgi:hypothetical protein